MANDEFREQQQAERKVGLKARHEARVERAIRRQVAEECAQAVERLLGDATHCRCEACRVLRICLDRVREIGAKETS